MLKGKTVVLGVTGGIAAYKVATLASMLMKQHAEVHVIMTEHAQKFITPNTFEALTHTKCMTDTFDRSHEFKVDHVGIAQRADLFMVVPATANVIAKMAHGLADDMLTTTILAAKCPKIVAPAMNTGMYQNAIVQDNMNILRRYGMQIITPASGYLACGDVGEGKLVEPEILLEHILNKIAYAKDMSGVNVLVTAGATREALDPVRYITNHSTGKMGYALAKVAHMRGAHVTLVSGQTNLTKPVGVTCVDVISAKDMYKEVMRISEENHIIIKAAAVADYRPMNVSDQKMKKKEDDLSIALERTDDIIQALGNQKEPTQFLCGFSMETENMIENSRAKLEKKNLDMIIANNLKESGAGFGTDTNIVTIITKEDEQSLPIMSKEEVASQILDAIMKKR
ncbi:MAG: bifunctional phosphopantothenoylcysteine decarboxylase/phosphopantothenate--cysteine ligase CoaBC [Eubacteriales bacterium]